VRPGGIEAGLVEPCGHCERRPSSITKDNHENQR
jgi:hypothetical protein